MNIDRDYINKILDEYNNTGRLLNKTLYDLCQNNFEHKFPGAIIAKTQLIGRTYAVALERRRNKKEINDNFYADLVVRVFSKPKLYRGLKALQNYPQLSLKALRESAKTHKYLTNELFKLTKLEKRSFSSKYLHFHLPQLFFIYDSRAVSALRDLQIELPKERRELHAICNDASVDKEYAKFACKCFILTERIRQETGMQLTTRELDVIFLKIANDKLAKKSITPTSIKLVGNSKAG